MLCISIVYAQGIYSCPVQAKSLTTINFIKETNTEFPLITANLEPLGNWARTSKTTFLKYPRVSAAAIDTLTEHQSMKIIGAVKSSYRVELPNGTIGYIEAANIEPATVPITSRTALESHSLLDKPIDGAIAKESLVAGENLAILAI